MFEIPRIVIAGAASGVGKTIITAGLAKALTRRGLHVATFKAGPDFIDPSFLSLASGRPSHNLDTWMLSKDALLEIFTRGSAGSDVAIIEGMMGLYDGRGPVSEDGSTAQLARALRAPVVLVVDAGRASRSIAALVEGYRRFDRRIALAGVVGNQLASKRHAEWVRQAIESHSPIALLGSLERSSDMVIPSRHLGLVQAGDVSGVESTIDRAADIVESYLDLDAILSIARAAPAIRTKSQPAARQGADRVRIGVARDAAFTFYYEANLDLLRRNGAEITSFSPLEDHALPENLAGLYIGGGYPEIHAHALAGNTSMREAMRAAANAGMPIYAECGGMLYLGRRLTDLEGQDHDMVGALSIDGVMESRRMALGYAETTALRDSPILARGWTARGHEFHWSRIVAPAGSCKPAYRVVTSSGSRDEGFVIGSIVASYVHLHFASQPQLVPRWLDACRSWRKMSMIPAHR